MSALVQSNTFAITLRQDPATSEYRVRAVDVKAQHVKHRVSFARDERINAAFSSVMVESIESLLSQINQDNMVFSLPDKIIETQGLILGRLRMLVSTTTDGLRNVILRFAHFIGHFQNAFAAQFGFETAPVTQKRLAETAVFLDIATPVLNIVSALADGTLPDGSKPAVEARLKKLHMDTQELRFHLELLRRHTIQNSDNAPRTAPAEYPGMQISGTV